MYCRRVPARFPALPSLSLPTVVPVRRRLLAEGELVDWLGRWSRGMTTDSVFLQAVYSGAMVQTDRGL
jgi:hypothetical protein